MDIKLNLVRGSLIGGAAGDALGYAVEFDRYSEIISKYGQPGITEYELVNGVAEISDDTQMTLFTANGMLMGLTRWYIRGIGCAPEYYVDSAYQDWYDTQTKSYESVMSQDDKHCTNRHTWLSALPELYASRAPGNTCLMAIKEMKAGRIPQSHISSRDRHRIMAKELRASRHNNLCCCSGECGLLSFL